MEVKVGFAPHLALIQPYLMYCAPLYCASKSSLDMQKLFILQKKCIRIACNKTAKQNNMFVHTKPLFFRLQILNIFNIYTYMTACEAMKIVVSAIPKSIRNKFTLSERSDRIILPKFKLMTIMKRSFVYNSAKILNYFLDHDIIYNRLSIKVFKTRLKKHLLAIQSKSLQGDDSWLPCNHDIFSSITF